MIIHGYMPHLMCENGKTHTRFARGTQPRDEEKDNMSDMPWLRRVEVVTPGMIKGKNLDTGEFVIHTDFPLDKVLALSPDPAVPRSQFIEVHQDLKKLFGLLANRVDEVNDVTVKKYSIRVSVGMFFDIKPVIVSFIKVVETCYLTPHFTLVGDEDSLERRYENPNALPTPA